MNCCRLQYLPLTSLLLLALPAPFLRAQVASDWVEVRSPNARVLTFRDAKAARQWAYSIERTRAVLALVVGEETIDGLGPFTLIQADRKRIPGWDDKDRRATVQTWATARGETVLLHPSAFIRPEDFAFHLLARQLVERFGPKPLWLNWGLTRFYASSKFSGNQVLVGQMELPCALFSRGMRVQFAGAGKVQLRDVVSVLPGDALYEEEKFSGEVFGLACALAHHMILGQKPFGLDRILDYQEATRKGVESMAALEQVLGRPEKELVKKLEDYRGASAHTSLVFKSPAVFPLEQIPTRNLPPDEAALFLGILLLEARASEPAQKQLELAIELNPALAEAHANLGELHRMQKRYEPALEALNRALELDPDDAYAYCARALLRLETGNPADFAAIQADLDRATRLRPGYATPYSALADLVEKRGGDPDVVLALRVRAFDRFHQNHRETLKLAETFLARRRPEIARNVATWILWSAYDKEVRQQAKSLLEQALGAIASAQPAAQPLPPEATDEGTTGAPVEPGRPRLQRRQNVPTRPAAVEGRIQDVSCQGFAIRLTLQVGGETRLFSSENLFGVEFLDAVEPIPPNFEPCKKLTGRHALVTPREGNDSEAVSVSLLP